MHLMPWNPSSHAVAAYRDSGEALCPKRSEQTGHGPHRVGVGFPEGRELLPFYTDPARRRLLPFYAKFWSVTFTVLHNRQILLRRAAHRAHPRRGVTLVAVEERLRRWRLHVARADSRLRGVACVCVLNRENALGVAFRKFTCCELSPSEGPFQTSHAPGNFYHFTMVLQVLALLPFYAKSRSLLPNPHPMLLLVTCTYY